MRVRRSLQANLFLVCVGGDSAVLLLDDELFEGAPAPECERRHCLYPAVCLRMNTRRACPEPAERSILRRPSLAARLEGVGRIFGRLRPLRNELGVGVEEEVRLPFHTPELLGDLAPVRHVQAERLLRF